MVVLRVALLASVFAFAACDVGEVPIGGVSVDGGGGNAEASAKFMTDVKPMLDAQGCSVAGATGTCHGNVQAPVMTSFDAMTGTALGKTYVTKPGSGSKLVLGPASIDPGTGKHPNPAAYPDAAIYLDATQKMTIQSFIDMYGL
jgi:hypothetical protein